jgi:hypothetical protein
MRHLVCNCIGHISMLNSHTWPEAQTEQDCADVEGFHHYRRVCSKPCSKLGVWHNEAQYKAYEDCWKVLHTTNINSLGLVCAV